MRRLLEELESGQGMPNMSPSGDFAAEEGNSLREERRELRSLASKKRSANKNSDTSTKKKSKRGESVLPTFRKEESEARSARFPLKTKGLPCLRKTHDIEHGGAPSSQSFNDESCSPYEFLIRFNSRQLEHINA